MTRKQQIKAGIPVPKARPRVFCGRNLKGNPYSGKNRSQRARVAAGMGCVRGEPGLLERLIEI